MGIYKRAGSPNYWCRFQLKGREYRQSTGTNSKRGAELFERQWRADLERELDKAGRLIPEWSVLSRWDAARAHSEGRTDKYIADSILHVYKIIARHFTDCTEVTEDRLLEYVALRKQDGVRGQTISKELTILKRGMQRAQREYGVPCPEYWPKVGRSPKGKGAGVFHGDKIFAWFRSLPPRAKDRATFFVLTGLRDTELTKVEPTMIERLPERAPIPALLHLPAWATKGRKDRVVGLSATALAVFQRAFPFARDNRTAFRLAAQRVGITKVPAPRDLRKTFATIADTAGDPRGTDMIMGHSSGTVAMRYQHADLKRLAKIALAVEAWFKVGTMTAKHE